MHLGLIAALIVTALPGCVYNHEHERYLRRSDSITIGAGNASAFNSAVQTVDPWPWYSQNANINVSGKKALIATRRYQHDDVKKPVNPGDLKEIFKGSAGTPPPLGPKISDPYVAGAVEGSLEEGAVEKPE